MHYKDEMPVDYAHGSLNQILGEQRLCDEFVRTTGYTLVLTGPPGAGKTSFGLYLLRELFEESDKNRPAFMLTLMETPTQIKKIARMFGLSFKLASGEAGLIMVMPQFGDEAGLNLDALFADTGQVPCKGDVLFIDGVSLLAAVQGDRRRVIDLIREIKNRGLFAILVGEEGHPFEDKFLEYAVDGIMRLSVDSETGLRNLEIAKWRWGNYFAGKHSFRLQTYDPQTKRGGVQVFPSVKCLASRQNGRQPVQMQPVASGTPGLDELIHQKNGAFRPGDQILLLGPPGVGKSLIGMQFLKQSGGHKDGASVLVSFSHDNPIKEEVSGLNSQYSGIWKHLCYGGLNICLDEVVGAMHNQLRLLERRNAGKSITRLFVEHLSELRRLFQSEEEFESFLVSFIIMLKKFPSVVSMISIHLPWMFASYARVTIPASAQFSVVIGLNYVEEHNRLLRGLVVLRAFDRPHETELKLVSTNQEGILKVDPKGGFSKVGLLSGDPASIHEERPFLKLFFQNASEEEVLKQPFEDFAKRYPSDQTFKMVCTKNPNPDHWSFLGYVGAGHSNTKIVILDKPTADIIRERRALSEVPEELVEKFANRFDEKLSLFASNNRSLASEQKFMLPYCADVGVLVYQWDVLSAITGEDPPRIPKTWEELLSLTAKLKRWKPNPDRPIEYLFVIPNPETDPKNFVAFFFELCWSYGWEYKATLDAKRQLTDWVEGEAFRKALTLMESLVNESGGYIPNPVIGGHYHKSVFSRRWFSKIHLRPEDAWQRAAERKRAFAFGIESLPSVTEGYPAYSCLNLYVLGVVSGALVPETGWMLASYLLSVDVDYDRALKKRGLPIVRTMLESAEFQGKLGRTVPAPGKKADFYEEQKHTFERYPEVLRKILHTTKPLFRRTSDIPRFVRLEKHLVTKLSKLFDPNDKWSQAQIIDGVRDSLTDIYGPS